MVTTIDPSLSEHSVPMVTHHIGDWVLTIEVATHADVGDNFWKSLTGSSIRTLMTFLISLYCLSQAVPTEEHTCRESLGTRVAIHFILLRSCNEPHLPEEKQV